MTPEEARREAARLMGASRSEAKARAVRENGKLGGGQFKRLAEIPCICGGGDSLEHKSTCPRGRTIRRRRKLGQPLT
jgi:hypothetical protein